MFLVVLVLVRLTRNSVGSVEEEIGTEMAAKAGGPLNLTLRFVCCVEFMARLGVRDYVTLGCMYEIYARFDRDNPTKNPVQLASSLLLHQRPDLE